jgi:histidine ammonia-lyase
MALLPTRRVRSVATDEVAEEASTGVVSPVARAGGLTEVHRGDGVGLLPRLRASEEQFLAVVANVPGAVYRCACNADWEIRFMSDHIERICGFPPADFVGNAVRSYGSIIHPEDRSYVIEGVDEALEEGSPYSLRYRIIHAEGSERWVSERGRAILSDLGERLWLDGVILDVTEQVLAEKARDRAEEGLKRQAELNRHQALHDSLTGLPNRVLFHDRVGQAVLAGQRDGAEFAVLVMDLDRFKEINDTLGHACGDRLLVEVGKRLQSTVREVDSIARLGGDEFAMLLMGECAQSVPGIMKRIRGALDRPFTLEDLPVQIDASIGVALYPSQASDVDGLIQRADVAMYVAKNANTGYAIYDLGQDRHDPGRLRLVSELRRAIDERELVLHYQPKIEVSSGRVTGVEALVRWLHPERGLVLPGEFIEVAQETSLIKPFTLYVVDEALRQCRALAQTGHEFTVAVNVSTRNLIDTDFPIEVAALLEKWGVRPELLELEITETAIVGDPFRMEAVLQRLAAMGLRLSVDDFGTGYTSLGYLSRLPINQLKIDRSFVANMTSSEDDAMIVRSAIDLGRNLGLEVVAEGVEDADIWDRLRSLGCDVAQGFLMSRPMPAHELASWLGRLPSRYEQPCWHAEPHAATAPVLVGASAVSVADVVRVATDQAKAVLDGAAHRRMSASRSVIERVLERGESVYGLTTGVGPQNTIDVVPAEQADFNRLMILAHCVSHGDQTPASFVRAAMFVRAHGLALGGAGVRPAVVETLLDALNAGVNPVVHLIGSVGQSDLSPMAEIARCLIGAGPDADLMAKAGLDPLVLAPREALGLISSNAFSVGIAALALDRAKAALQALELSAALCFEGFIANVSALDPAVATLRPHEGIATTIERLRELLAGGALLGGVSAPRNLQDPLCFRNIPQTHATAHHALSHAIGLIQTELCSAADNPAVLVDQERVFSHGNHDATPVAVGLDYARLGLTQAITIANERIQKLLDSRFSGLPSGLRARDDLAEDGLAVVGHGSTALAAECRLLAAPVTLEQTSSGLAEGIEDRVTLAPVAARRLHEMAGYAIRLAAVELICAAQAIDLRGNDSKLGRETTVAFANVRKHIPFIDAGQTPIETLDPLVRWLEDNAAA